MSSFIVTVARLRSAVVLLIVSVSLVALLSTTTTKTNDNSRNHFVVHGFLAPPIRQTRTRTATNIIPAGHHYNSFITTTTTTTTAKKEPHQQHKYHNRIGFTTTTTAIAIATTRSSTRLNAAAAATVVLPSVSLSFLSAIPSALWWILGHNILANAGVPFVLNGSKDGGWYSKIDLPSWIPNKKLFGPVWTFLYTLMGLAVSRICSSTTALTTTSIITKNNILLFWAFHFSLNIAWAPIFFGLQRFRLGLIVNYVLVATLGMIVPLFYTIDKISALLLLPYAIWLSFATYLNVAICKLNPTDKDGYNDAKFQAQLQRLQKNAATYAFGV
jgi:benzodiazapine receptor